MSTHTICVRGEIKKKIQTPFWLKENAPCVMLNVQGRQIIATMHESKFKDGRMHFKYSG